MIKSTAGERRKENSLIQYCQFIKTNWVGKGCSSFMGKHQNLYITLLHTIQLWYDRKPVRIKLIKQQGAQKNYCYLVIFSCEKQK